MKLTPYFLFTLLIALLPQAHAQTSWSFGLGSPSVEVEKPMEDIIFAGEMDLCVTIESDSPLRSVSIRLNNQVLIGSNDTPLPTTYETTIQLAEGEHQITVLVWNETGFRYYTQRITAMPPPANPADPANRPPVARFLTPTPETPILPFRPFTTAIIVDDPDDNVATVHFHVNGSITGLASEAPFLFEVPALPPGTHYLGAIVRDTDGETGRVLIPIEVVFLENDLAAPAQSPGR